MAQTKLSKIAWTFAGTYVSGQTYEQLTIVDYEGSAYLSKADGVTAPPSNEAFWVRISRSMTWADMTENQKKDIADEISGVIGVSLLDMEKKIEAVIGSTPSSNFAGIYTDSSQLPELGYPAWALVGASLAALKAYQNDGTSWNMLSDTTYDYTDFSGMVERITELATKVAAMTLYGTTESLLDIL